MTNSARAIVFPAPNRVEIQEYQPPTLRAGELLVRTEYSGVSQGTEIYALLGRRVELEFPTVPGYQSIGVVEEIGEGVSGFQIGQRVLFAHSRLPDNFPFTWMGAHLSHAVVATAPSSGPEAVPVPAEVDPVGASLAALAAVSLRGIQMINIQPGDLVVVIGQGLIGQGSAQLARLRGAIVVASDVAAPRLEKSREFSADRVINVSTDNLADAVRGLKPGGADGVIETSGRSQQFAPCIELLRWEGQLLLQGYYPEPITFDFFATHLKKPTIAVTCGFDAKGIAAALELMRFGKLNYRDLVTHLVLVSQAPELYTRMAKGDPDVLGVVFDWNEA